MTRSNIRPMTALLAGAFCLALSTVASAHPPAGTPEQGANHEHTNAADAAESTHESERAKLAREEVRSAPREWLGWGKREVDPFDHIERPLTNLNFHHPFIRNEVRALFMHHNFPATSALGNGRLNAYALQVNLALTEGLLFTAYKDGYADLHPRGMPNSRGFVDIAFGLKAVLTQSDDSIFAAGLGYETKTGAADVLEGQGSGVFDLFGSYATTIDTEIGDFNLILTGGFMIPTNSATDSRQFHYHVHVDTPITDELSAMVELNGQRVLDEAHRDGRLGAPLGFEGADYTNLGSNGTKNNDVVTLAAGLRYKLDDDISIGGAYELSVTPREDIFQDRFTLDLILRF